MCAKELETEQNSNILTLTLLAITAFLSRFPGLLNRRPGGPLCWVLAFSTASCLQPTDFLSSPSYIIVHAHLQIVGVTIALIQPIHGQGYDFDIPRPDAHVIYKCAFPILTARPGRRPIYNTRKKLSVFRKILVRKLFSRMLKHGTLQFSHSWSLSYNILTVSSLEGRDVPSPKKRIIDMTLNCI